MTRYWIKFALSEYPDIPFGAKIGCGVTALNYTDALDIVSKNMFNGKTLPPITEVIENINISTLDQNHVIPNMKLPFKRGIWFPLGYDQ